MTRLDWMIVLGIAAALLFVTCQSATAPAPDRAPVASERTPQEQTPAEEEAQPVVDEAVEPVPDEPPHFEVEFADFAFPPTISDVDYHKDAWIKDDCLRCHETGVGEATVVKHEGMKPILLAAKCRSCHVLIPGQAPIEPAPSEEDSFFADFAFPPMIPASDSHKDAWTNDNCLLCHEDGVRGAPIVRHKEMPALLLEAKCRSCHVQVRSGAPVNQ